ncbi:MAG: ribosome maturation factor RimM [Caldilineaceae bacterium]
MANSPSSHQSKSVQSPQTQTTYQHRNQPVIVPDGYVAIGRITAPHSLSGEVRVELHTDFPERFEEGLSVFIGTDLQEATVDQARPHKQMMLLKLAGVNDRNQAERLRDQWLFIAEEDTVLLDEDTYWVHDIIGLTVQTESGDILGVITDVLFTGANDVYILDGTDDAGNRRELLLPAIADVVQRVEPELQRMTVRLLPGLLPD